MSLLGSLGKYTSPIWLTLAFVAASKSDGLDRLLVDLGSVDEAYSTPIREDGFLKDGDGSFYWWLANFLPGFRQFRYPAKLFTFTSLAFAALGGLGWDRLCRRESRGSTALFTFLLIFTAAVLAVVLFERRPILQAFRAHKGSSMFGPLDVAGGFEAILRSLTQASIVFGSGLILTLSCAGGPLAGGLALLLTTADLAIANSRYILTVDQSLFEAQPEVLKIIEDWERADPAPGPFRVHRMAVWNPLGWSATSSQNRVNDFVAWERDTSTEVRDPSRYRIHPYDRSCRALRLRVVLQPIPAYRPQTGYRQQTRHRDRQGSGVLPAQGFRYVEQPLLRLAPFPQRLARRVSRVRLISVCQYGHLSRSRQIHRARRYRSVQGMGRHPRYPSDRQRTGVPACLGRPSGSGAKPIEGLSRESRRQTMEELLYADDPLWYDPTKVAFDPHQLAWVGSDIQSEINPYLSGRSARPGETVRVTYPTPQQAVLDATLESPGLVVLADVFYPGWVLTIDGKPATIYRVNGLMRGAAVPAGNHRLVYTYKPRSFQVGLFLSAIGLGALLTLGIVCKLQPVNTLLSE